MKLNTYLNFDGNCEAAFRFYADVLGGKISAMMAYEGTPAADHVPPGLRAKILHARIEFDDQVLMGSDVPPGRFEASKGYSVTLDVEKPAEAERVFAALAASGTVHMPLAETFFAKRFGMLVDRFGIPWMVVCEQAD